MKRRYRILSFILVLSLLFSSFVFTSTASTEEQDEYYVDENAELFTPTAHYTALTEISAQGILEALAKDSEATNNIRALALFGGSNLSAYLVTSETTESYVMIVPTKTAVQNGKVTDHAYFNSFVEEVVRYDSANPTYYIYEMDVATESGILPLFYQVVARNYDQVEENGKVIDAWATSWYTANVKNSLYMTMAPGVFHHMTFVADVDNNILYVYMDNQLVHTQANGVMSQAMHSHYLNGAQVNIEGLRTQINNGVAIDDNMSFCFKDIYERVLIGNESDNLISCVGKPTLHGWSGSRYEEHTDNKLPALIKINGVDYNNTVDASKALDSYKENNEAELLRSSFSGDITVDCDALIHTYAAEVSLTEGPHATLTKVDGSTWQATLHTDKYSTELVTKLATDNSYTNLVDYLKYDLDGNIVSQITVNNPGKGVNADIMRSSNGNEYIYVYDGEPDKAYDTSIHFYMNASIPFDTNKKDNAIQGHDFIVFDFDIYSEGELVKVYNGFVPRAYSNSAPLTATAFNLSTDPTWRNAIAVEPGIWNHFTFVGEVATGTAYVYINNQLVRTISNGLYKKSVNSSGEIVAVDQNGNEYTLDDVCINSFRCMQVSATEKTGESLTGDMSICFDNFDARFVDGDATLVAGMQDLSGWITNLYGNGYLFKELPAIAAVDGVEYYDTYSLTEALTPLYPTTVSKKVVLLREFKGKFTVNCNAVIEARGFESHIALGEDCTSSTSNGIVTVTCPMEDVIEKADQNVNDDQTLGNISGGSVLDSGLGILAGTKENTTKFDSSYDNLKVTKVSSNVDTNPFYIITPTVAGSTKINSYISYENWNTVHTIPIAEGASSYYVIDLDVATSGEFIPNVNVSAVLRRVGDASGFPFSADLKITEIAAPGDKWAHLTIVGDIASNQAYLFVNGEYEADLGYAYNASQLTYTVNVDGVAETKTATELYARGFRLQFGSGSYATERTLSQDLYVDNFAERIYQSNETDNGLSEAIEAGSLKEWADYYSGRGETILPPIVLVDGVPYASQVSAELALAGEKTANVEVISAGLTALRVNCNAVINTNGFNVNITYGSEFTATTNGNIVTVSGHFVENMQPITTTDNSAILNSIKYPADDNLLSAFKPVSTGTNDTISWGNEGGRGSELITNTDNGNVYYKEYLVGTAMENYSQNGNDYVDYNFKKVDLTKEAGYSKYVIVDFDFAYEGELDAIQMQVITRGAAAYWPTVQRFNSFGIEEGRFVHITAVYDYQNNYAYIFVNGELHASVKNGALSDAGVTAYANGTSMGTTEFRVGSNSTSTIYLDNMYIRSAKIATNDTIAESISAGTTRAWVDNVYTSTYNMTDWPAIATVNGINYSYHDDIQALLDKVDTVEMEFKRLDSEAYTFSSPATVKTNGLAVSYEAAPGYQTSFNSSNNTLTVSSTGEGTLTLNINGVQVLNKTLPYGTDIRGLLSEYGFGVASKTIAYDGDIYTGVTWTASNANNMDSSTGTPTGYLSSNLTLTATGGTLSDTPFLLLNASGAIVNNGYTSTDIMNFFLTNGNGTIILGDDWTISTVKNQITSTSGTMNVCLNGYSIIDAGDGTEHTWRYDLNAVSTQSFNFYGGTLDFDKNVTARTIFYTSYTFTGNILLKNIDIDTSYSIVHLRSGSMELIGCDIDAYLVDAAYSGIFQLAEDYNTGFSKNPINLTITNTDIDHRYHDVSANTAMIVHRVVSDGYKVDPKVTVIINNSDIVTQYALVEAYKGHQTETGILDTDAAEKSNMTVYLNKVSLVAESLANGDIKQGSVVFYEDVRTNINDTTCVAFIKKLSKVKSSDGMTPYLYSSYDYGSVTWSNGNAELWATGSLPTHETCKFDNATTVEQGVEYNYTATAGSAPIKFLANLTLSNEITFNFYVPTSKEGTLVYLDGVLTAAGEEITYVDLAGTECYNYSISFSPEEASKEFVVSMIVPNGNGTTTTMSRTLSVGLYAEKLLAQIQKNPAASSSIKNKALLGAALNYIKAASTYSGVHTDLTIIEKVLGSCDKPSYTPNVEDGVKDTSALGAYIKGVQINAASSSRFRFNLVHGADISTLKFYVDGTERDYTVSGDGSYVELSLRAYEMTHNITITVNGLSAEYNLYTYYAGLQSIASGAASGTQKDATNALEFIKALYNYASVADEHLDAKVTE